MSKVLRYLTLSLIAVSVITFLVVDWFVLFRPSVYPFGCGWFRKYHFCVILAMMCGNLYVIPCWFYGKRAVQKCTKFLLMNILFYIGLTLVYIVVIGLVYS